MKRRKTLEVRELASLVNRMLARSTVDPSGRRGIICVLETVLHNTGNYSGFRYLTINEVPKGELPGINGVDAGATYDYNANSYTDERFNNNDDTRREYYYHE